MEKRIKEKIAQGYLHIRAIVEIVGKPKEYVKDTIKEHLKKIKEDEEIELISEHIEPPVEQDNFFSSFAEIEIITEDVEGLLNFCFDYMPSSVEILEPETLYIKGNNLSDFINDLQARVLALNTGLLQLKDRNKFYIKNTAVLLRNFIVVLISGKPMSREMMLPYLGVKKEDIEKVLQILVNEGKIKKKNNLYYLIK